MASTLHRAALGVSEPPALWSTPHLALVPTAAPVELEPSTSPEPRRGDESGPQAFCEWLKAVRERRGITLAAISESTKVSASLFAAMERGDLSHWPKGIYRRAFFRSFVVAIGLPPDSTLEEFLRHFPDAEGAPVAGRSADELTPAAPGGDSALRLTLGRGVAGAFPLSAVRKNALIDGGVVLGMAIVLLWWTGADVWTATGVVGLCYYPQIADTLRRRMRRGRLSTRDPGSGIRDSESGT